MRCNLTRELRIACAGAGKSTWIVSEVSKLTDSGTPCLIVTYTEDNQTELKNKLIKKFGKAPHNVDIKGWFSFLLEDMIRPYQSAFLRTRIQGVNFNESNPHIRKSGNRSFTISGTGEQDNPARHFTTTKGKLAHTYFISKLAERIFKASNKASVSRLQRVYGAIFIDEVQDLVGWDYEVLAAISKSSLPIVHAVGDFRQTIYQTAHGTKGPRTDGDKIAMFSKMEFETIPMSGSHRCCQTICDISNLVYSPGEYEDTVSIVDASCSPLPAHSGVFTLNRNNLAEYISSYCPTVLRQNKNIEVELCEKLQSFTFGKAKGKQFDHILIVPTEAQKSFFLGNRKKLDGGKTNKSVAQLYVALTRARHSVAILMEEESKIDFVETYMSNG